MVMVILTVILRCASGGYPLFEKSEKKFNATIRGSSICTTNEIFILIKCQH